MPTEDDGIREWPSADERRSMLLPLGIVANAFGDGDLTGLARRGDLSVPNLQRGLADLNGRLRRPPEGFWGQYAERFAPSRVPDTDPAEYEVLVPLWTDEGMTQRAARLRLAPSGWKTAFDSRLVGFEDITPGPEWASVPPDTVGPPEPLDPPPPRGEYPVPERWRPVLWDIVHLLVVGDYAGLEEDGIVANIDDPERDMVTTWVEAYHDPLVDLPEEAWEWSDHHPAYDGPGDYSVVLSMWTAHQGLSLLSMEADVFDHGGDDIRVEVLTVHVM